MVLILHDELPQPNETERDEERESRRLKEKIQEEFFALTPSGVQCVGGVLYVSLASISPLFHPRESLKPNKVPAEEFLHPARVCVLLCCTPPLN